MTKPQITKTQDKHKNQIEFRPNDKRYRYIVNGEVKKGVTTLIGARFGKNALINWAKGLPYKALEWQLKDEGKPIDYIENFIESLKEKSDKLEIKDAKTGSMMHSICEDYIMGVKVVTPETEPLKTMYSKFTKWWDKRGYKVLATEQTCYSADLDVCGTFDAIIKNKKGQTILLDFKTSKDFYPDQPIQLATYKKLIEDSTDIKIDFYGIINIPKDKLKDISIRMYKDKQRYLKTFKMCKYLDKFETACLSETKEWKKQQTQTKRKKNVR